MPRAAPGIFGAIFCTQCGQRMRSINHVCQPSALKKWQRTTDWSKRSQVAAQPAKKK